jgi:hypothetical protein
MIADPVFPVSRPDLAEAMLNETLAILYRAGSTGKDRCDPGDLHLRGEAGATIKVRGKDKDIGPYVLSHELRETLLEAARHELRAIRQQLWLPVIMWNTLRRRDERAVWKLYWRPARRQEFRDGVCVAELLVAVKHRLNEKYLAEKAGKAEKARRGRGAGIIERFWQRKGLQVVAAVTGDSATVRTILHKEFSAWPAPSQDSEGRDAAGWIPPTRDRVRWLPWQARTASWMAAYNTACLYAVLLQQGLAREEQVIASLRRLVNNRDSGLERPYDWISNDPDFAPLLAEDSPYPAIRAFREDLERRDYPAGQTFEVRWPESRHPAQQAPGPASGQASLTE